MRAIVISPATRSIATVDVATLTDIKVIVYDTLRHVVTELDDLCQRIRDL